MDGRGGAILGGWGVVGKGQRGMADEEVPEVAATTLPMWQLLSSRLK